MPLYSLGGASPIVPANGHFWIAPGAHVIGKVRIEEGASIWFGAVLRGDLEEILVGEGSNIQDGAVLHTDPGYPLTISPHCTIGHRAILHGCTIGENTLIGMGATLLNGAKIGRNSIVGANALVTEGKEFPDASLIVGCPAKLVRALSGSSAQDLRAHALRYAANGQRFAKELAAIG